MRPKHEVAYGVLKFAFNVIIIAHLFLCVLFAAEQLSNKFKGPYV